MRRPELENITPLNPAEVRTALLSSNEKKAPWIIPMVAAMSEVNPDNLVFHSMMVSHLAALAAFHEGLAEEQIFKASLGGLLHDLGKLAVPIEIIVKEGRLSAEEKAKLAKHADYGSDWVREHDTVVADIIATHHDDFPKICGEGDDRALIKMMAIVALADRADAMLSPRIYRPYVIPREEVIDELCESFNPQLVEFVVDMRLAMDRQADVHPPLAPQILGFPKQDVVYVGQVPYLR